MEDFLDFFSGFSGSVLLLLHHNADHDAIGSAIALKEGLSRLNESAVFAIGSAKGISRDGRKIPAAAGEEIIIDPGLEADLIILVDTSTLSQLGALGEVMKGYEGKVAVIDHHARHSETEGIADFYIVDEGASSTAELVHDLLKKAGVGISARMGEMLLVGIFADTGHLRLAGPGTIRAVCELLEVTGVDYNRVESLLEVEEDVSRKVAHLKAAQRMEVERVGEWIIASSEVGSFGASAARALVMLGADVVFVGSTVDGGSQVSARASKRFLEGTKIHLGRDIMPRIGELIGGSGGGHAGAAGASGKKDNVGEALAECVKLVKEGL